ncbi:MAG: hypothetical protein A3C46_05375 [Deltaproteobacteria bacterium RIFCSPHIGHO2_02_FULL_44_16]|nr:MAG: hypothetical protein A3C46_05375 [Deltaproteobacteria bacterium RIFCSPHIGHO2_02_FULL_44_16]
MKRIVSWGTLCVVILFALPVQASVGYKDGFYLKSDDENFQLTIRGGVTPRLEFTDSTTEEPKLGFRLRTAYVSFKATMYEKLKFTIKLAHSTQSANFRTVNISGGAITYTFRPEFELSVGFVGLPLGMEENQVLPEPPVTVTQYDTATQLTVTRASFGNPAGLGVDLAGEVGRFFYDVAAINSNEDQYTFNDSYKFSYGAKAGVNILQETPSLAASAGINYSGKRTDDPDAFNNNPPVIDWIVQTSTGLLFTWKRFAVGSDVYWRWTDFQSFGALPVELREARLTDFGYHIVPSFYLLPEKLQVAVQVGQIFREGADNNANQFGGGLNWFIVKGLKAQVAYFWTEDYDNISGANNDNHHRALIQLEAKF